MDTVTELTMAVNMTFNSILNEIQFSKLNFAINLTLVAALYYVEKVDSGGQARQSVYPLTSFIYHASAVKL